MARRPGSEQTSVLLPRPLFSAGRGWPWGLLLVLAVLLAYGPVWRAGFVWDDSSILTANPCIVGPLGFRQIWTTYLADICPLTISALWLEHALWGLSAVPYHVVNVLLHAANALVLWRVLRRLRVPGAWLGAALWALHPVEVESVAWVAELKNTLSGLFFLGSIFFFLRGLRAGEHGEGQGGTRGMEYGLGLLCAALAMTAKSSTVVLPMVVGLCAWRVEHRVGRRWIVGLSPLVLLAAAASAATLWTQAMTVARVSWGVADGTRWARPWPGRLVTAGEAVWFYLGKLFWPHPLIAVYPRWQADAGRWLEWLPLLAAVATLSLFWWRRGSPWGRPCFFAFAYFLIALLPVLGLFDGTIFRYSLVFDHFQYLASMGPLALAGAGMARLAHLTLPGGAGWRRALGAGVLLVLGTLSWQRSEVYRDEETFWTDTLAKNPGCWLGRGNLGSALLLKGRFDEARAQYEQTLAVNPDYAVARNNLGVVFMRQGKTEKAITEIERAVTIDPDYAEARSNLGDALSSTGQVDAAIAQYEKALAINPDYARAHNNLGVAFVRTARFDEAIAQYEKALAINPADAAAYSNLGNAFLAQRRPGEAIAQYEKALAINPDYAEAHYNLGIACMRTARFNEAAIQFQEALRLAPDYPNVRNNLDTAQRLARRNRPYP